MKYLGIIIGVIFVSFGLLFFIFANFIYGHVDWIDTSTFQINIGVVTSLSIFIFALGLVILLKNTTRIFDSLPRILFVIRKISGWILLANLIAVIFIPPGPFLWLMFFNVVLIFCPYLLFTKRNGYIAGIFFFLLGLAYAIVPIFPGPTIWMTEFFTKPNALADVDFATEILLLQVMGLKAFTVLLGCFILLTAFFKKTP